MSQLVICQSGRCSSDRHRVGSQAWLVCMTAARVGGGISTRPSEEGGAPSKGSLSQTRDESLAAGEKILDKARSRHNVAGAEDLWRRMIRRLEPSNYIVGEGGQLDGVFFSPVEGRGSYRSAVARENLQEAALAFDLNPNVRVQLSPEGARFPLVDEDGYFTEEVANVIAPMGRRAREYEGFISPDAQTNGLASLAREFLDGMDEDVAELLGYDNPNKEELASLSKRYLVFDSQGVSEFDLDRMVSEREVELAKAGK